MTFGNLNTIGNSIEYKIKAINFQKSCSILFPLFFPARRLRTHTNSVINGAYVFSVTNEKRKKKQFIAKSIFKLVFLLKVEKWLRQTLTLSKSHTGHIKLNLIRVEFVHVIDVSFSSFSFQLKKESDQEKKEQPLFVSRKASNISKRKWIKIGLFKFVEWSSFLLNIVHKINIVVTESYIF